MTEEGFCNNDTDCSEEQYCYQVSKRCVDYPPCSRYNRQENQRPSRNPSQCGPCLPGYNAEKLGTGEIAAMCRKANIHDNIADLNKPNINVITHIVIGMLLVCCVMITLVGTYYKIRTRKSSKRCGSDQEQCGQLCTAEPSAPPVENHPFIDCEGEVSYVPFNNNESIKDKNRLVSATAFKPPNWIRLDPNYENNLDNDDINTMEQLHSTVDLPPADDNSSTWSTEQLTLATNESVTENRNVTETAIEQIDNSTNVMLIERNNSPTRNTTEENYNNNSNNNNNGSSTSNNTQDDREHVRGSNILIAPSIFMNVNLLNDNY